MAVVIRNVLVQIDLSILPLAFHVLQLTFQDVVIFNASVLSTAEESHSEVSESLAFGWVGIDRSKPTSREHGFVHIHVRTNRNASPCISEVFHAKYCTRNVGGAMTTL